MVPMCRYSNCHRPAAKDVNTKELSEYCGKEHLRFVDVFSGHCHALMLNFARWVFREDLCRGVPACPACRSRPRRVKKQLLRILVREVGNGKAATVEPQALVPPPGSFNWASIAGGSLSVGSPGAGYQPQASRPTQSTSRGYVTYQTYT